MRGAWFAYLFDGKVKPHLARLKRRKNCLRSGTRGCKLRPESHELRVFAKASGGEACFRSPTGILLASSSAVRRQFGWNAEQTWKPLETAGYQWRIPVRCVTPVHWRRGCFREAKRRGKRVPSGAQRMRPKIADSMWLNAMLEMPFLDPEQG